MKNKPKKNRLVVRHVVQEFFGRGNLDDYENFIAKDVHVHCPASWEVVHLAEIESQKRTKKIDQEYAQAFQFSEMKIGDIICQQDKVFVRWGGAGVHGGNFFSIPATNRPFTLSGQTLYRINHEQKIEEVWQSWDMLGLFKSIGFSFQTPQLPLKNAKLLEKQFQTLSSRERACLKFFLHGKTSKETAIELGLSFRTIEYYFENIKDKLNCSSKRELFRLGRIFESFHLI